MSASGPDLNLLVPLHALLEEANVTRAGQRVQMGQSSMSSALARLRAQFDDELLVRVGRDYELTPLARLLLPQVRLAVPMIERMLSGEQEPDPSTATRTISIMMTDFCGLRLRPAIATILAEAPGIDIGVVSLPERPMDSERDLLTHDFVVIGPGVGIDSAGSELFGDHYVCLMDAGNPAIRDGMLSFEDFLQLPQAVAVFGKTDFTPADRRLRELGVHRGQPRVRTTSFLPLPSVVAGTDLVAVVPGEVARRLGPATGTIGVPAPFGEVPIDVWLWWHESYDTIRCTCGSGSGCWTRPVCCSLVAVHHGLNSSHCEIDTPA